MSLAMRLPPAGPAPLAPPPAEPLITRCGTPSRTAVLTALVVSSIEVGSVRPILMLTRTGRPRSLAACPAKVRWLALQGLLTLYPDANEQVLAQALGCRPSADRRRDERWRRRELDAVRSDFTPAQVDRVARTVSANEDPQLTARWVWPIACEVAARFTGAEPDRVLALTGRPGPSPAPVARARKIAAYLTASEKDVNHKALAEASGLDRKHVREMVAAVEDSRDDPDTDETLDRLAAELGQRLDEELSGW
jgi:hypothetical protein